MERSTLLDAEMCRGQWFAGVIFNGVEHKIFFLENLNRCRYIDPYHLALVYCLGINKDCRQHIEEIFDFDMGGIKPECLDSGWLTSGSNRVIRLAFNLYTNGMPIADEKMDTEERLSESAKYAVDEIFCSADAKYFWQAIKFRYPEYCE